MTEKKDDEYDFFSEAVQRYVPPPEQGLNYAELAMREQQRAPVDFDFGTMVGNIPESGGKYLSDMANAVMNPVDTAYAVGDLASGGAQNAADWVYEGAGGKIADFLGLDKSNQVIADAVGQFYVDRYGSADGFKRAAMEDPVGVLADVSMLVTGGAGAAAKLPGVAGKAMGAVSKTASYLDPINMAGGTVAATRPLQKAMYRKGLNFPGGTPRADVHRVSDFGFDNAIRPRDSGVRKLDDMKMQTLDDVEKAVDNIPGDIRTGELYAEVPSLTKSRSSVTGSATPQADAKVIQDVSQRHAQATFDEFGYKMSPRQVHETKKSLNKAVDQYYRNPQASTPAAMETNVAMARGAKNAIDSRSPDVQRLNKALGEIKDLRGILEPSVNAGERAGMLGMSYPTRSSAAAAGMSQGGAVGAGFVVHLLRNLSAESALALRRASINSGAWQGVRAALLQAGRTEEEIELLRTELGSGQ